MTGSNVDITARGTAMFIYDVGADRWILINVNP
jgi:hypothetical protein